MPRSPTPCVLSAGSPRPGQRKPAKSWAGASRRCPGNRGACDSPPARWGPRGERLAGVRVWGHRPGRKSWEALPRAVGVLFCPLRVTQCGSSSRNLDLLYQPLSPPTGAAGKCGASSGRFYCFRRAVSGRRSSDSHFPFPLAVPLQLGWLWRPRASRARPFAALRPQRQHGRRPARGLGGGGPGPRGWRLLLHLQAGAGPAARRPEASAAFLPVRR